MRVTTAPTRSRVSDAGVRQLQRASARESTRCHCAASRTPVAVPFTVIDAGVYWVGSVTLYFLQLQRGYGSPSSWSASSGYQVLLGMVVVVDAGLGRCPGGGGGIHSARPSLRFRVVQPPSSTRRLWGPHARVSLGGCRCARFRLPSPRRDAPGTNTRVRCSPVACSRGRVHAARSAGPGRGKAFGVSEVQRLAGVLVVDHQIVMGVAGEPDHVAHRQQHPASGNALSGSAGFEVLQRGGHDDAGR